MTPGSDSASARRMEHGASASHGEPEPEQRIDRKRLFLPGDLPARIGCDGFQNIHILNC